jgi:hypothetical protein
VHEYPETPIPTAEDMARQLADAPRNHAPPPARRKLVVLVGEDPGRRGDPDCALYPLPRGCAGDKLRDLTCLSRRDYLATFVRVNLHREYPGRWSAPRARAAAEALAPALDGRLVVLLGARVREAFGWGIAADMAFEVREPGPGRRLLVATVPHPSGRCRDWNPPSDLPAEARAFFSLLLRWLREDAAPLDAVLGARVDPASRPGADLRDGVASAPTLVELLAAVERGGLPLLGPPRLDAGGARWVRVREEHETREPCGSCGRQWPRWTAERAAHLCPPCRSERSGHGL